MQQRIFYDSGQHSIPCAVISVILLANMNWI